MKRKVLPKQLQSLFIKANKWNVEAESHWKDKEKLNTEKLESKKTGVLSPTL